MFKNIKDKTLMRSTALSIVLLMIGAGTANASDSLYGVSSIGYVSNEIDVAERNLSLKSASYKIALGYEVSKSWSFEVGFQALGEENLSNEELNFNNSSNELSNLYLSALGKANNRQGELFYRIGVARIDTSEAFLSQAQSCPSGGNIIAMQNNAVLCQLSDSKVAGILGIGFDFHIHHSSLLRLEVEQMSGEGGYSATAGYIGVRLNF